jgi:hypothetical protein
MFLYGSFLRNLKPHVTCDDGIVVLLGTELVSRLLWASSVLDAFEPLIKHRMSSMIHRSVHRARYQSLS